MLYPEAMKGDQVSEDVSRAAAKLASRGASKGGRARAAKLTPERRREIATRAIQARWRRYRQAQGEASDELAVKHLSDLGWSREEAAQIRASLLSFEEDWSAPGMELYDLL